MKKPPDSPQLRRAIDALLATSEGRYAAASQRTADKLVSTIPAGSVEWYRVRAAIRDTRHRIDLLAAGLDPQAVK